MTPTMAQNRDHGQGGSGTTRQVLQPGDGGLSQTRNS